MMSPVIIALDYDNAQAALDLASKLDPSQCRVKVGKELFTRAGPDVVGALQNQGFDVFLDLKFHDIPTTTAKAVLSAADLGVWMVNLHISAGVDAMKLAKQQLLQHRMPTLLIGVTVLTSMNQQSLQQTGVERGLADQVEHLAAMAKQCELDGVVCSAQEAGRLREQLGSDFLKVTPGIRMAADDRSDQTRVCTPKEALDQGATHLVIGRSITSSADPMKSLDQILRSIA